MSNVKINWGILGTGMIAKKFAGDLPDSSRGALQAVGSRSDSTAKAFADQFGGRPYGGYDALLADADVEAVYISLPNGMHHEWTLRALDAGKHVLCEKPLANNATQVDEMFSAAERSGRVLVEAFMYRSHPKVQKAIALVHGGAVGEVRVIRSNFAFCREADPADARYQPAMAGGSLMDVGCYCVNFCRALVGGEPTAAHAVAHLHDLGVDDYAAGALSFDGAVVASFTSGMTVFGDWTTTVCGSEGYLAYGNPWFGDGELAVVRGESREVFEVEVPNGLYAMEADTFAATVQDGAPPTITKEDSLGNMRVLDLLRRQIGLPM